MIGLQSWTSTIYFLYSTGSYAINCLFSPIMGGFQNLLGMTENGRIIDDININEQRVGHDLRVGLHHGPWSRTMDDGLFHGATWWSNFHGPSSWKNKIYKVFEPLTRCKSSLDQEERPCTKNECAYFFLTYVHKGQIWNIIPVLPFSGHLLPSSSLPPKKFIKSSL